MDKLIVKIFLLLVLFFIICCTTQPKETFVFPNQKDIDEIVETIIFTDSLPVAISFCDPDSPANTKTLHTKGYRILCTPISINLQKLIVLNRVRDEENNPLPAFPPGHYRQYYDELLFRSIGNEKLFSSADSSYIFFQNDTSFKCDIGVKLQSRLFTTTRSEQMKKKELKINEPFFEMSCPLLSKDKTRAFVELSFFCKGCGSGSEYYLQKLNGKWKILRRVESWIN